MNRNRYNMLNGIASTQPLPTSFKYSGSSGFQRTPLYPIGPTLTQPQFKPLPRGISPSPYLNRDNMRPPSYDARYQQKSQLNSINYEEREKRLIDRNEREIEQQQKRRQQIRFSYQREIKQWTQKLNRNMKKKQKLHEQIQILQNNQYELNQKLCNIKPPQKLFNNYQSIDRKQQQIIILKNKLMLSMRQNQIQLYQKQQQQQKYWQQQISIKQKILFQLQQNLRQKRLQLHLQKQKLLDKPDLLSLQQQIRQQNYNLFIQQYQNLQQKLKKLTDHRDKINKQIKDMIELKKPQLHNNNIRRHQLKRQFINLQLKVAQLERISSEMNTANQNLLKQLQRKQSMVSKYQKDIQQLKSKKLQTQSTINQFMTQARQKDTFPQPLNSIQLKIQQDIRNQQAKGTRLKNAYQKLYQLLCSTVRKDIQQTFHNTVSI